MGMKYELVKEDTVIVRTLCGEIKLYRIRALKDFSDVKKGDLGGYIEKEENLSHDGNCWVYDNSKVFDNARVCDSAIIRGNAVVGGKVVVIDNAIVCGDDYNGITLYTTKDSGHRIVCTNFEGNLEDFRKIGMINQMIHLQN